MAERDFKKDSTLKIFLSYFKGRMGLFILDMACVLTISAIELIYPLISRKALNELLPKQAYKAFFITLSIVIAAYVFKAILNYVVTYYGHKFGNSIETQVRSDLFAHLQTLSFEFYDNNRTGALMSRLTTDLFEISELAHHGPEDVITSVLTLSGALIMIFTIQWRLALVLVIIIPIFILIVAARRKHYKEASRGVKAKAAVINTEIESSLSGMRTSKAFANEEVEKQRFAGANKQYFGAKQQQYHEMAIFKSFTDFSTTVVSVIVIMVGGYLIMKNQMTLVDLVTFSLYVTSFTTPITRLSSFAEQFATGTAGLERFISLMKLDPSISDKENALQLHDVKGDIELSHVNFEYKNDLPVLKDISLTIHKNETIAIVGPSGGGKTTLISLLPRFYEVNGGSIKIDGIDIRDLKQDSLRRQIGIVQQDVFLFADTVRNNIAYGKIGASEEEIIEAAKKAEIYDDILAMPQGLDTYVGERGTMLSGGQKQRIAIARIFLKNPPILILDEATSALDTITESKIQAAFDALAVGRTTLIIAHRLSTIRKASRIIVIDEGLLKEQGSHEELMKLDGIYAKLYNTQTKLHS